MSRLDFDDLREYTRYAKHSGESVGRAIGEYVADSLVSYSESDDPLRTFLADMDNFVEWAEAFKRRALGAQRL